MVDGIGPVRRLPGRSKILSAGSDVVMHSGIGPVICFQSATTRFVRRSSLQIEEESLPDIRPEFLPDRTKIGSSDSPRSVISATRPLVGSQLTPYQFEQQFVPVHEEKMPRYGSERPALKSSKAVRSESGHEIAMERRERKRTGTRGMKKVAIEV